MRYPIKFHHSDIFIIIIFNILLNAIRKLIINYYKFFSNQILFLFFMFLGESFSGFLYLYEQNTLKNISMSSQIEKDFFEIKSYNRLKINF